MLGHDPKEAYAQLAEKEARDAAEILKIAAWDCEYNPIIAATTGFTRREDVRRQYEALLKLGDRIARQIRAS